MTRVFGKLFEDGRDGVLVIKPSQAFFGASKNEKSYKVSQGSIDLELQPTPAGIQYLVAFKEPGDFTKTEFTLRWRIPPVESLDITPQPAAQPDESQSSSVSGDQVQLKRLATELSSALNQITELKEELNQAQQNLSQVSSKFEAYKHSTEKSLTSRDAVISQLQDTNKPEVKTVIKEVPVAPEPLNARILFLEQEVSRLKNLNAEYYEDVVELHQLKLDRAQSLPSPGPITTPEDSPRQRLINKLFNR
tara:strand:+ start:6918 stop:7664 length:747 start_codon:yes stop_codon:yes gene_type:complete